jgi:GNAT superfamily N-acetyltransferase
MKDAPVAMTMTTRIEALSTRTLKGANAQANSFIGTRKGLCCGLLRYSWCPVPDEEFGAIYKKYPENMETCAVAVDESNNGKVVGFMQMSLYGQEREGISQMLHRVKPGEAYIDQMSVAAETRGQGIGTRLLQWSEDKAREQGATRLTLGVVHGNPAERLYKRFGFEDVVPPAHDAECDACCNCMVITCLLGCPNGRIGGKEMEKPLH